MRALEIASGLVAMAMGGAIARADPEWRAIPVNAEILDVVTTGDAVAALGTLGVWRSTDGGATWSPKPSGPSGCATPLVAGARHALWVPFCNGDLRAYVSVDGGGIWTTPFGGRAVLADDGAALWAWTQVDNSFVRSDDRGKQRSASSIRSASRVASSASASAGVPPRATTSARRSAASIAT
jgi:hypothetical protein